MTKYNAKKTAVNGITFDSKKEARRYKELRLMERAGEITDLELQPRFRLQEGFTDGSGKRQRPIDYIADFMYTEKGIRVVEDVKGKKTQVYGIKKKLFLKRYPQYEFRET